MEMGPSAKWDAIDEISFEAQPAVRRTVGLHLPAMNKKVRQSSTIMMCTTNTPGPDTPVHHAQNATADTLFCADPRFES